MVQVSVGEQPLHWMLPIRLLCHLSTFFYAALNAGFREAADKRVTLREERSDVFRYFAIWLYCGDFTRIGEELLEPEEAWVLGDKLGAPAFQNCVMGKLQSIYAYGFIPGQVQVIDYVYRSTVAGSPLRLLVADLYCFNNQTSPEEELEELKKLFFRGGDFVVDVMTTLRNNGPPQNPSLDAAKYLVEKLVRSIADAPQSASSEGVTIISSEPSTAMSCSPRICNSISIEGHSSLSSSSLPDCYFDSI